MRHLSLFTGSGIGDLAARDAGITTVAMCESDPACCYCLERLWPDARLFRDVHDVTAESLADLGPIDIISGGFPCQDISTAGKGAGLGTEKNKTRSGLWYEFARVIRETRPTWLLIENVPALRVRGGDRVCEDLESMGYAWEAVVVGADDVGAPHRRKRVWIVARNKSDGRGSRRTRGSDTGSEGQREQPLQDELDNANEARRRTRAAVESQSGRSEALGAVPAIRREATGELGHPASNDQRRAPVAAMHGAGESAGGSGGSSSELANGNSQRLPQPMCERSDPREEQPPNIGSRWPARPGEPQHEWEWARLLRTDRPYPPKPGDPEYSRVFERAVGDATDGIPRRVRSRANKALLRMVGNAWCYPVALMLFRGIVELSRREELTK
jgi:DNA (cytosine-5)-methyltransferase 1